MLIAAQQLVEAGAIVTSARVRRRWAGSGSSPNASASVAPSPVKVTSGILAFVSDGNKQIYSFIDPNSGQYSEAVTFTIPSAAAAQARRSRGWPLRLTSPSLQSPRWSMGS